ncbi:MAG: GNAT family N-acetyltransferase, partial [Planctomycetota bacterium]
VRAGPFRILYAGIPYGGPIGEASEVPDLWEALRAGRSAVPADQVRYVPYRPHAENPDWARVASRTTTTEIRLEGRTEEEYERSLPKAVRSGVRRAGRLGVRVVSADEAGGAERLFDLYAETMRRKRTRPKYTPAYFSALARHPAAEVRLAVHEGAAVAGVALLTDDPVVHYLHAASTEEGRASGANDLLAFEAIREALREGRTSFDLGPSDPEDEGLLHFKRKWGGTQRTGLVHVVPLRRFRSALSEVARRLRR